MLIAVLLTISIATNARPQANKPEFGSSCHLLITMVIESSFRLVSMLSSSCRMVMIVTVFSHLALAALVHVLSLHTAIMSQCSARNA